MTPKLAPIDYIVIFLMILLTMLAFFFFSNEAIVSVDADGKISEVAYVKKSLFVKPKAKVGDVFKKQAKAKPE